MTPEEEKIRAAFVAGAEWKEKKLKENIISFGKWLNRPEARYAPLYKEDLWVGDSDEKTTEQLYDEYYTDINKKQ